jgi:hypothetical protein
MTIGLILLKPFALTFAFSQFMKSSSKIETMKVELQSQMTKEAMEVQKSIAKMAMEMR